MNALEQSIQAALESAGESKISNKAYLEFIKANFFIPVEKDDTQQEPRVLFMQQGEINFLPVFSSREYLESWAKEIAAQINVLHLTGVDLLKGIEDNVYVCLNIGSEIYKEFIPAEIARMRSMVLKLFKD